MDFEDPDVRTALWAADNEVWSDYLGMDMVACLGQAEEQLKRMIQDYHGRFTLLEYSMAKCRAIWREEHRRLQYFYSAGPPVYFERYHRHEYLRSYWDLVEADIVEGEV